MVKSGTRYNGGCFSELGWDALMELSETERNKVIYNLFNPQEANFNYNRMPMGLVISE